MSNRRKFIIQSTLAAGTLITEPLKGFALPSATANKSLKTLTIFSAGSDAGYHRSLSRISSSAAQRSGSLVVATGNIIDAGTGNKQQHLQQLSLLKKAGCDAITPGSMDLAKGAGYFHELATECNIVSLSVLNQSMFDGDLLPYHIQSKGDVKIGIIGNEVMNKSNATSNVETLAYKLNKTAAFLKTSLNCNLIVAVNPTGKQTGADQLNISDKDLASLTKEVDVIISKTSPGKTFGTYVSRNAVRKEVIINCQGTEHMISKAIDVSFNDRKEKVHIAIRPVFS